MSYDDDDDDLDDRDDRNNRNDRRDNRGQRDGKKGKKGGPRILDLNKDEDLSEAESLTTRIVLNVVESAGDALGTKFGDHLPFLKQGGAALVSAVGPTLAPLIGTILTGVVAAKVQVPSAFKELLGPYVPAIVSPYTNELIDSTIRAVGKTALTGKINVAQVEQDAKKALDTFLQKVQGLEIKNLDDAIGTLTPHDRKRYRNLITQVFTPAQRSELQLYELKLMHVNSAALVDFIEAAFSVDANQAEAALAYLRANYPDVKPKKDHMAPLKKIGGKIEKALGEALEQFAEHPEQTFNEIADAMDANTAEAERAQRRQRRLLRRLEQGR